MTINHIFLVHVKGTGDGAPFSFAGGEVNALPVVRSVFAKKERVTGNMASKWG